MKKAVEMKTKKLNTEERNLLSVAYKNIVGLRRSAWRSLLNEVNVQKKSVKEFEETIISDLIAKVFEELKLYAEEVVVS